VVSAVELIGGGRKKKTKLKNLKTRAKAKARKKYLKFWMTFPCHLLPWKQTKLKQMTIWI
jgi:hypothetical protein